MPLLSRIAAAQKCRYFLDRIPKDAKVLEIGCGGGWAGEYLRANGWTGYKGMDLYPPADIVGNISHWRQLGLAPQSFNAIIAFEVMEHVDCFQECFDLLMPGGLLMATSPVPERDWIMKILERVGLNQKRTSPHDNLVDFRSVLGFELAEHKHVGGLSQWGVFRKPAVEN